MRINLEEKNTLHLSKYSIIDTQWQSHEFTKVRKFKA